MFIRDKKILRFLGICHQILFYYMLTVFAGVCVLEHDIEIVWMALIFIPVVLFSDICMENIDSFWVATFIHIILGMFCKFIGSAIGDNILLLLVFAFLCVVQYYGRVVGTRMICNPSPWFIIFYFAIYAGAMFFRRPLVQEVCMYVAYLFLIDCFIYHDLIYVETFLYQNRDTVSLPSAQIRKLNKFLLSFFLVIVSMGMFFISKLRIEGILSAIWRGILAVLRFIGHLLPESKPSEILETELATEQAMEQLQFEAGNTLPQWMRNILNGIVFIIGTIVIIAFLMYLGSVLYKMYRRFSQLNKNKIDEEEYLNPFEKKEHIEIHFKKRKRQLWSDFSPSGKMRKYYKKIIHKQNKVKNTIPQTMTPNEIESFVDIEENEDRSLLHENYEKSRYSNQQYSKEDFLKFKNAYEKR